MNAKQAKRLRRAAVGLAVHLDSNGKKIDQGGYDVKVHEKAGSPLSVLSNMPDEQLAEAAQSGKLPSLQLLVKKASLKGIYKDLKKAK